MSRDELSRLVGDAIADPVMIQEAMSIRDRHTLEEYVAHKGYRLTEDELSEMWDLTSKVLSGHMEPMSAARWRLDTVKNEVLASLD